MATIDDDLDTEKHRPVFTIFLIVLSVATIVGQLLPMPGLILMFFGFLPALPTNAIPIVFAAEVVFGPFSKKLLLLPLLYFGGYFGYSQYDRLRIESTMAANTNSGIARVDLGGADLVLDGANAASLAYRYDIPEVFYEKTDQRTNKTTWRSVRFLTSGYDSCDMTLGSNQVGAYLTYIAEDRSRSSLDGCMEDVESSPPDNPLRLTVKRLGEQQGYIVLANGNEVMRHADAGKTLNQYPFFIHYCSHSSTISISEGCIYEFARENLGNWTGSEGYTQPFNPTVTIGDILGLSVRPEAMPGIRKMDAWMSK